MFSAKTRHLSTQQRQPIWREYRIMEEILLRWKVATTGARIEAGLRSAQLDLPIFNIVVDGKGITTTNQLVSQPLVTTI